MKFVIAIIAGVAIVGLLAGCDGSSSNTNNGPKTTTTLTSLVQQLLAADANSEPTPINNLAIQNQLDAGDPLLVDSFLP